MLNSQITKQDVRDIIDTWQREQWETPVWEIHDGAIDTTVGDPINIEVIE
jgi:hypothetical protein